MSEAIVEAPRAPFWTRFIEQDRVDLVVRMTMLLLLVHPSRLWFVRLPVTAMCIVGILHRPLGRDWRLWLGVAALQLFECAFNWAFINNHDFLIAYWSLALGCALLSGDARRGLALNGRILIGLVFLFATLWKLSSPTYMDASMFRFLLLEDYRFFELAHVFGGYPREGLLANTAALGTKLDLAATIRLQDGPGIAGFAVFMTWWTILIEGALAVFYLLPERLAAARFRHWVLVVFLVTTYPPINVVGFAWLLLIMSVAQTSDRQGKLRALYLVLFVATYFFTLGHVKQWVFGLFA
ncbi:MAG: hypothetical protein GY716_00675 [bacterium]|nr:hypothetical protein [bacterium]